MKGSLLTQVVLRTGQTVALSYSYQVMFVMSQFLLGVLELSLVQTRLRGELILWGSPVSVACVNHTVQHVSFCQVLSTADWI